MRLLKISTISLGQQQTFGAETKNRPEGRFAEHKGLVYKFTTYR